MATRFRKVSNDLEGNKDTFDKYASVIKKIDSSTINISNIEVVYNCCEKGAVFGQDNLIVWLKCSKLKAMNMLRIMRKIKIIEEVR